MQQARILNSMNSLPQRIDDTIKKMDRSIEDQTEKWEKHMLSVAIDKNKLETQLHDLSDKLELNSFFMMWIMSSSCLTLVRVSRLNLDIFLMSFFAI